MPNSINLLTTEFNEPKSYRYVSKTSIIVLSIYMLLLVIAFGTSFFLTYQKNQQTSKVNQLISLVEQKKDVEELITTIKNRATVAQAVYTKGAPSPSELINNMIALLPQNVSLQDLQVEPDGKISLVVTSKNSQGIVDFVDKIRQTQLTSVVLNSLSINNDGFYVVSLDIRP